MNTSDRNNTSDWQDGCNTPLVSFGRWTISDDRDGLTLWQLSYGCLHAAGRVTEADLEELQVCLRRALAVLADRSCQERAERGGQS